MRMLSSRWQHRQYVSHGLGILSAAAALALGPSVLHAENVTLAGRLEPTQTVVVGSYVSGTLQEVTCDFNTPVKKGQICAKIDPRRFERALEQARAAVEAARAQRALHKAALDQAKSNNDRNSALFDRGIVAKSVFEGIASVYAQAQAQVELDDATIKLRTAELEAAELNLGYTSILAPLDGVVLERRVSVGETVAASFQAPSLFVMAGDLKRLQIIASVAEGDVGGIKPGSEASFTAKAFPKKKFAGKVAQVRAAPQAGQSDVRYAVVIDVDNEDLQLMPGMTVSVSLSVAR